MFIISRQIRIWCNNTLMVYILGCIPSILYIVERVIGTCGFNPHHPNYCCKTNYLGTWRNRLAQESYTFKVVGSSPAGPTNMDG